jgi:hypothetical protein
VIGKKPKLAQIIKGFFDDPWCRLINTRGPFVG